MTSPRTFRLRGREMRRRAQRGIVMILFTVGALAVLAMVGLALDLGRVYMAKTRLQNALDAAALDGAKTLYETGSPTLATTAANTSFGINATTQFSSTFTGITPTVETSQTLVPFTPGGAATPRYYVRVRVAALPITTYIVQILPGMGSVLNASGTAVAGPETLGGQLCGAFPVAVCGTSGDPDCSDYKCYGINGGPTTETVIQDSNTTLGPGNYGFVQFGGCNGGSCLRDQLAGAGNFCFKPGGTLPTKPGKSSGPAEQGFNTRFGKYSGPVSQSDYPPDVITSNNPVIYYNAGAGSYRSRLANPGSYDFPLGVGVPQRRVVLIPIIDCGTGINGSTNVNVIGGACFFLTQPLDSSKGKIYGQLLPNCEASGTVGPPSGGGGGGGLLGPIKIVLFQDPDHPRGS